MTETQKKHLPAAIAICLATFMGKLDTYIVNISLPDIARRFGATPAQASLIVLSFLLCSAGTMLVCGKLADSLSLKKLFIRGYWLFSISSLGCAFAQGIWWLVLARAVQGVGAAVLLISAFALVPRLIPAKLRGWAFGMVALANAVGVGLGTPLGGLITTHLSWRWIFLINVPIGLLAASRAGALIEDAAAAPLKKIESFDYSGAAVSFCAIALLLYAVSAGGERGWFSHVILFTLSSGIALLGAFIVIERRAAEPVLPPVIFGHKQLRMALAVACIFFAVMSGANFIAPFYLEYAKGLTADMAALAFMLYPLMHMIVAPRAGRMSDVVHPTLLCAASLIVGCCTFSAFSIACAWPGIWEALVFFILYGIANALFISPSNNLVMGLAPEHSEGSVAGLYNTLTTVSMAVGVALFETAFTTVSGHKSGNLAALSKSALLAGFRGTYMLAVLMLFIGLCLSADKARKVIAAGFKEIGAIAD
jgi:EmrB/QacA subfamily drug resistance transporter